MNIEIFFPQDWSVGEANVWLREHGFAPTHLIMITPIYTSTTMIGNLFYFALNAMTFNAVQALSNYYGTVTYIGGRIACFNEWDHWYEEAFLNIKTK